MSIFLLNRDPEPNEENIPLSSDVFLEIVDDSGADIDNSQTVVQINGTNAYVAGVFQSGFDGPNSSSTSPAIGIRRIRIDPTSDFLSLSTNIVRVNTVNDASPPKSYGESYLFIAEDLTPPELSSVKALKTNRIRVIYDEPINQISPTASGDSLNPANYTFERLTVPAVTIQATSVSATASSIVEITTDIPMSPGALYRITVSNVKDLKGNVITSPNNTLTFEGFLPPQPTDRSFSLWEMLPLMNRNEDLSGDLQKFISCLQEVVDLVLYDVDKWVEILDPDTAPEEFLDVMLLDLGNPFKFELDEIDKRRLLRVLRDIYQSKGTAIGIKNVVRFFLGLEIEFYYYGDPGTLVLGISELGEDWYLGTSASYWIYSFDILVTETLEEEVEQQLREIVEYMKPAHTHLVRIIAPTIPEVIDHLELGLSRLGTDEWNLH